MSTVLIGNWRPVALYLCGDDGNYVSIDVHTHPSEECCLGSAVLVHLGRNVSDLHVVLHAIIQVNGRLLTLTGKNSSH